MNNRIHNVSPPSKVASSHEQRRPFDVDGIVHEEIDEPLHSDSNETDDCVIAETRYFSLNRNSIFDTPTSDKRTCVCDTDGALRERRSSWTNLWLVDPEIPSSVEHQPGVSGNPDIPSTSKSDDLQAIHATFSTDSFFDEKKNASQINLYDLTSVDDINERLSISETADLESSESEILTEENLTKNAMEEIVVKNATRENLSKIGTRGNLVKIATEENLAENASKDLVIEDSDSVKDAWSRQVLVDSDTSLYRSRYDESNFEENISEFRSFRTSAEQLGDLRRISNEAFGAVASSDETRTNVFVEILSRLVDAAIEQPSPREIHVRRRKLDDTSRNECDDYRDDSRGQWSNGNPDCPKEAHVTRAADGGNAMFAGHFAAGSGFRSSIPLLDADAPNDRVDKDDDDKDLSGTSTDLADGSGTGKSHENESMKKESSINRNDTSINYYDREDKKIEKDERSEEVRDKMISCNKRTSVEYSESTQTLKEKRSSIKSIWTIEMSLDISNKNSIFTPGKQILSRLFRSDDIKQTKQSSDDFSKKFDEEIIANHIRRMAESESRKSSFESSSLSSSTNSERNSASISLQTEQDFVWRTSGPAKRKNRMWVEESRCDSSNEFLSENVRKSFFLSRVFKRFKSNAVQRETSQTSVDEIVSEKLLKNDVKLRRNNAKLRRNDARLHSSNAKLHRNDANETDTEIESKTSVEKNEEISRSSYATLENDLSKSLADRVETKAMDRDDDQSCVKEVEPESGQLTGLSSSESCSEIFREDAGSKRNNPGSDAQGRFLEVHRLVDPPVRHGSMDYLDESGVDTIGDDLTTCRNRELFLLMEDLCRSKLEYGCWDSGTRKKLDSYDVTFFDVPVDIGKNASETTINAINRTLAKSDDHPYKRRTSYIVCAVPIVERREGAPAPSPSTPREERGDPTSSYFYYILGPSLDVALVDIVTTISTLLDKILEKRRTDRRTDRRAK